MLKQQKSVVDSVNNHFVKLFLKDFALKAVIEDQSDFFRSYFQMFELDKIFEEYSEIHKLSQSKRSGESRRPAGPKTEQGWESVNQLNEQSVSPDELQQLRNRGNQSARLITQDRSIETHQWKSYKTLLSKGDMAEARDHNAISKISKRANRKQSDLVTEREEAKPDPETVELDSFREIGISAKKIDKDVVLELSLNQNSSKLGPVNQVWGSEDQARPNENAENQDDYVKVINALESYHEHSQNHDPVLSEKLIKIKEIIQKSSNKNLLISRLINDFSSTLEQGPVNLEQQKEIYKSRLQEEQAKRPSVQSQKHREVIQNIFLSRGVNQQNSSDSSSGEITQNSLSFGLMRHKEKSPGESTSLQVKQPGRAGLVGPEHGPDQSTSAKESDGILIRTKSRYVEKLGSGVYREQPLLPPRKSIGTPGDHRIHRITEESESRDKHTGSRNVEEPSSLKGGFADNSEYSQSHNKLFGKTVSARNMSFKTEVSLQKPDTSKKDSSHDRNLTQDSIKKYLELYDKDSELGDQSSHTNGSIRRRNRRGRSQIEKQTLNYLANYEGTEDLSSPTETDNKVSFRKQNTIGDVDQSREVADVRSVEENKLKSLEGQPKCRTFSNLNSGEDANLRFNTFKKDLQKKGRERFEEPMEPNAFAKGKEYNHNFIKIRDMVLQNSGRSSSNDTKRTLDLESPQNGSRKR